MHLLARFTGDPFRVSDLTPAAALFAEVESVEQLTLALFQVSPRPAALVGPRQYRLGGDRHHTPGRHETLRAVLISGISYAGAARFWWLAPCPSLPLMLFSTFSKIRRCSNKLAAVVNHKRTNGRTPNASEDFCCAQEKIWVWLTRKKEAETFDLASKLGNLRSLHRIKKHKHPGSADIHLHALAFISEFGPTATATVCSALKLVCQLQYLQAVTVAAAADPAVLLAANNRKMLALAGSDADGTLTYFVPPEHTAEARSIVGEGKVLLAPHLRHVTICLVTGPRSELPRLCVSN